MYYSVDRARIHCYLRSKLNRRNVTWRCMTSLSQCFSWRHNKRVYNNKILNVVTPIAIFERRGGEVKNFEITYWLETNLALSGIVPFLGVFEKPNPDVSYAFTWKTTYVIICYIHCDHLNRGGIRFVNSTADVACDAQPLLSNSA